MALDTNIIAAWNFDESSGNPADATGNGYTLTNNGTATFTTGKINNAISLNGTSQYASIADAAGLRPAHFTIAGWVNFSSKNSYNTPFSKNYASGTWAPPYASWLIRYDNGTAKWEFGVSDGTTYTPFLYVHSPTILTWYHIGMTYDGSNVIFYLNGTAVSTNAYTSTIGYSTGELRIGNDNSGVDYFPGLIDATEYYSRALSSTEMATLATPIQYPFTTQTVDKSLFMGMNF